MTHLAERKREPSNKLPPYRYAPGERVSVEGKDATVERRNRRCWTPQPVYRLRGERWR